MNKDSRGLRRLYRGRNFVPRSQDILYGSIHPKDGKTEKKDLKRTHIRLGHGFYHTHMRLGHGVCAQGTEKCGSKLLYPTLLWEKSSFWAQLQVETLPINTAFINHNFSFINGAV